MVPPEQIPHSSSSASPSSTPAQSTWATIMTNSSLSEASPPSLTVNVTVPEVKVPAEGDQVTNPASETSIPSGSFERA